MKRDLQKSCFAIAFLIFSILQLRAQQLPQATPESVGFSSERLARIDQVLEGYIDDCLMPGAVVLIARHGKVVHFKAHGKQDIEANIPMQKNTLFRLASMSKIVTTVGAMMLFEEGKFSLNDPVSRYIPAFADAQVLVEDATNEQGYVLEAARSPMLVRHLLTHTSGLSYGLFANPHLRAAYQAAGVSDGLTYADETLEEWVAKIATVPLANHPGENFEYGLSTDVLGRLIEIWSGMPLDEFFQKRIFEPLQMSDTHFFLPAEKVTRLTKIYEHDENGCLRPIPDTAYQLGNANIAAGVPYKGPQKLFSGGGGLVSTAQDYARFAQMLLNGGKLGDAQLLSCKTVELMISNQIGELGYWSQGYGFGYGVYINRGAAYSGQPGSVGTYGWSGYYSTYFWIDPKEDVVAVLMTQVAPWISFLEFEFPAMIYQALED